MKVKFEISEKYSDDCHQLIIKSRSGITLEELGNNLDIVIAKVHPGLDSKTGKWLANATDSDKYGKPVLRVVDRDQDGYDYLIGLSVHADLLDLLVAELSKAGYEILNSVTTLEDDEKPSTKVVGDTAYSLLYKDTPPLTDAQADALIIEYSKLGLNYKKCVWQGRKCIIIKAQAAEYEGFKIKLSKCWKAIHEKVGHGGCIECSNTYNSYSHFSPDSEWDEIVAFIESNYSSSRQEKINKDKNDPWWKFWKSDSDAGNEHEHKKVKFVKERKSGKNTYYDYKADSDEIAIEFLKDLTINENFIYHQVYTSNGLVGKDIIGLYKQKKLKDGWGGVQTTEEAEHTTQSKDYSQKIKKCLNCNTELATDQIRCPDCGSDHYIWE